MATCAPYIEQNLGSEALAPTDMMYLVYTLARIRPVAPDSFIVQRIKDMQHFKGLEIDAVLLQFWLAGLTGLAEANTSQQRMIWKSLVLVKMPSIIARLVSDYGEITTLVGSTLRQLSFYRSILDECDECLSEDNPSVASHILLSIAIGCRARGLVHPDQLSILKGHSPAINDLDKYSFGKSVYMFNSMEIIEDLCGRILSDFELQEVLVERIITVCEDASANSDVSTLSKLCQTLDDNPLVLDLIHLLRSPSALLAPLEGFVNHLQQNEDDDIDSCNSNLEGLGVVLALIMTIIRRYELGGCLGSLLMEKNDFCYLWLHRTSATISPMSLSTMHPEMQALMGRWISALFDSMGISDDLIQTSKPQMLLEISPSIFEQSLAACQAGIIDATTLNSGLDYFLQPCLLFVLIGVVQYLCEEILSSSSATYSSTPAKLGHQHRSGSISVGHSIVSPASGGHTVSPLANRGMKPHPSSSSHAGHGGGLGTTGKSSASMAMLQSSLKSLLAGDAFPPRLMRLLKNEISSALDHPAMEQDHQLTLIHEKLAAATVNDYSWSDTEAYDVSKLSQQASLAFEAIVSGGRTPLVNKKEKGWPVFGGSSYHIDVDLFRTTLCYLGPAQFVTVILKQVLRAALTTHGRRAVELGAAIITTPLMGCGDPHLSPQSLLWTLFYRTLWIPVPGRLETFSQGLLFATFVGMTLDMFQSRTYIQMNEKKEKQQNGKGNGMEVDTRDPVSTTATSGEASLMGNIHGKKGTEDKLCRVQSSLERDAAMEPFRIALEERLQVLSGMVQDRPGFEGFLQGMRQYRQRHPPMANLVQSRKVVNQVPPRLIQKTLSL